MSLPAGRRRWRRPARLPAPTRVAALVGLVLATGALVAVAAVPALHRMPDIDLAAKSPARVTRAHSRPAPGPGAAALARSNPNPAHAGAAASTGLRPVTGTVAVGTVQRTYDVFAPPAPTSPVPALIVLHGRTASVALEEGRDGLVRLAREGKAIVVYPVGYAESWNAGACCGAAWAAGVDDRSFVTAVIHRFAGDPSVSSVSLIGYSNGGKMAYDLVCSQPKLVGSFVVVAAVPTSACPAGSPVSLLELVGTRDPLLSYDHTTRPHVVNGFTMGTVVDETAAWRRRDGCTSQESIQTTGSLRLESWTHCSGGTMVELGTYQGAGHAWPAGGASTPSAADVLWTFISSRRPVATPRLPLRWTPRAASPLHA